jgi:hypothetical protein
MRFTESRFFGVWWYAALVVGLRAMWPWLSHDVRSMTCFDRRYETERFCFEGLHWVEKWRGWWPDLDWEVIWHDVFPWIGLVFFIGWIGFIIEPGPVNEPAPWFTQIRWRKRR